MDITTLSRSLLFFHVPCFLCYRILENTTPSRDVLMGKLINPLLGTSNYPRQVYEHHLMRLSTLIQAISYRITPDPPTVEVNMQRGPAKTGGSSRRKGRPADQSVLHPHRRKCPSSQRHRARTGATPRSVEAVGGRSWSAARSRPSGARDEAERRAAGHGGGKCEPRAFYPSVRVASGDGDRVLRLRRRCLRVATLWLAGPGPGEGSMRDVSRGCDVDPGSICRA